MRAAVARGSELGNDALYAFSRGLTAPAAATSTVKADLLTTEVVGLVDVSMLTGNEWLTERFTLVQSRAGGLAHSEAPPTIRGSLSGGGDRSLNSTSS